MGQAEALHAVPGPRPRTSSLAIPVAVLVDAIAALAAAGGRLDVAAAALPVLQGLPGVRAAAVVQRDGDDGVVLASVGYPCEVMGPGARLPLDAGLPVTEAVRTGEAVRQGEGPSWVAVPFARRGLDCGLLLSLHVAPPYGSDLSALQRLARALGDALERAQAQESVAGELSAVDASLAVPAPHSLGLETVVRQFAHCGTASGDVLLAMPDGHGGSLLLAADVCGSGLMAALVAGAVRTAVLSAVAAGVLSGQHGGPAALLAAVEQAVLPVVPAGRFVTALAVHVRGTALAVASAGHPPPLLLRAGGAELLEVEPSTPLALEAGGGGPAAVSTGRLPHGSLLLLYTDGLVERRGTDGVRTVDAATLAAGLDPDAALEDVADALLAAADRVGRPGDDVGLLLTRRNAAPSG